MKKFLSTFFIFIFLAQFSAALAADTTPPAAPRGFDAAGGATPYELLLTWTNPADSDLDHINVYLSSYGAYSAPNAWATVAAQPNTKGSYTISALSSGTTYYVYIAAVDSSGNKSPYVTELQRTTATNADKTSPAAATNFTAQDLVTDGATKLSWTNPADTDFFQVRVYRDITSDFTPVASNEIAQVFGLPSSIGSYTNSGLTNGQVYYYKLRTEDNRGNLQSGLFYPSASATPTKAPAAVQQPPAQQPQQPATPTPVSLVDLQGNALVDGDLIKTSDNPDIYIVKLIGTKKFRRLILNPDIFNSYGHLKWSNVKTVSQDVMNAYTVSSLVIEVNPDGSVANPKVFSLTSSANSDTGVKHWLNMTPSQFQTAGYDWDSLYHINHNEAGTYTQGSDITQ